ncbi:DUF2214 domain-containing protein [Phreatobacter sp.]|uniref:DUF2214 domain-containing protein n=1 Tax=Phreatobacter sp. TaxID=1966341 RepID=UPI003F72444C
METLGALLSGLGAITGVALSSPRYAAVSALHIAGIAFLIGGIVLVDLRLVGLVRSLDTAAVRLLRRLARSGAVLAIATGIVLVSARPDEYLANRVFLAKLAVIALALANAALFEWLARRRSLQTVLDSSAGRLAGALSLVLWPAALALGRWIAFV